MLFQRDPAVVENLLDMRAQFARLRIDDLEFLLDAEGENMILLGHHFATDGAGLPADSRAL